MSTDPVFMKIGGNYYWYQNDHLGTPQKLTTSSGAVVWSATYTSFGKATVDSSSTVVNPHRFPGQYEDAETGLHYNYHRYYNPNLGKYLRVDPIGLLGGINYYLYVRNNTLKFIDPRGLDYLLFDGSHLYWLDNSHLIKRTYPANSGPVPFRLPDENNKGKLPEGWYVGNNLRERTSPEGMTCPYQTGWSLDLTDKQDRDLLRIHPDGNVPGTLGCIGVECGIHSEQLYNDLKQYFNDTKSPHILVKVQYFYR